jgi:hypothetical protein
MTDADLMDANCPHGETWWMCKECEREMNTDLMGGLGLPHAIELTPDELDLLQNAIAGDIADFLIRANHRGIDPSKNDRYQALLAMGRKLGLEL